MKIVSFYFSVHPQQIGNMLQWNKRTIPWPIYGYSTRSPNQLNFNWSNNNNIVGETIKDATHRGGE